MTAPNEPPFDPSDSGQSAPTPPGWQAPQSWQPQPGWQPQPSWELQHGWDQPPIAEITPAIGAEEPAGWQPAAWQPAGYAPAGHPGAGFPVAAPPRRPRRIWSWILGAAVAVLLLLIGGGAVAAFEVLNGGGTQPDQVVPADAVAFAKLDLNPSAAQKISAARFLHRIPKFGTGFGGGSSDWRKAIFDALASGDSVPPGVNFDRDIKPWLGKRAAVAVLPELHDGDPEVLLVLQSTDDAKARAGIARFGSDNGVSFYHGYAVVAQTRQIADQAVASAKAANLAGSAHYSADMKQLGSLGVSAGWADIDAAVKLAGKAGKLNIPTIGRLAYTVRLSADSADLIGKFYGLSAGEAPVSRPDLDGLPVSTAVAVGLGTDPAAVDRGWKNYQDLLSQFGGFSDPSQPGLVAPDPSEMLDQLQQQFGLRLPEDLKTLVGTGVTVSVAAAGLNGDTPKFVLQSRTDGAAAVRVMDNIRRAVQEQGGDFPVEYRATPSGLILGNDPGYLATVSSSTGAKLSGLTAFRRSLPDRAGADYTAFVNLDAVAASMRAGGAGPDELRVISAFSAAGMTMRTTGTTASVHVRLLAH